MRLGFRRETAHWQGKNADFGQVVRGSAQGFVHRSALALDPGVSVFF